VSLRFNPSFPNNCPKDNIIHPKNDDEIINFFQPSGNMGGFTQADTIKKEWKEDVGIVNRASKTLVSPLHLKGGGPNFM